MSELQMPEGGGNCTRGQGSTQKWTCGLAGGTGRRPLTWPAGSGMAVQPCEVCHLALLTCPYRVRQALKLDTRGHPDPFFFLPDVP